ncbi:hypothetical protein AN958_01365 [Leucoagaricus sp. SymC.cos]|nr:hypothetical protein AN958_01365 [Leucoagaricus sp. SymC.cos]
MTFSISAAHLSGLFCEAIFYGMYLVTCTRSVRLLFMTGSGREERWRRLGEIRWVMTIVALILFTICTLDITMSFSRDFRAVVKSDDAETVLMAPADWTNVGQIYRCWIVYGRRWLVIIPSALLYLANLAISLRVFAMMGAAGGIPTLTNAGAFRTSLLAFCSTIAAQNVLTTGILIWRIWLVDRAARVFKFGNRPRYLQQIIRALAESGALYTTVVLLTLIFTVAQKTALYVVNTLMIQAAGVAFNMILVRCSPERDHQFSMFHHNELATLRVAHQGTLLESGSIVHSRRHMPRDLDSIGADSSEHYNDERLSHKGLESKGIRIMKSVEVEDHV